MSGVHISVHKIKKPLTGSLHGDNGRILASTPNTSSCKAISQNTKEAGMALRECEKLKD